MFVRVYRAVVIGLVAVLLAACATQPVHNVTSSPIVTTKANPTMEEITQAIVRAGTQLTWQMRADRPGHILGTIALLISALYLTTGHILQYREKIADLERKRKEEERMAR